MGNLFHAIKLIASKVLPVLILSGNVKLPETELKLNLHSDLQSFRAGFPEQLNSDRMHNLKPLQSKSYADFPVAKHLTGSSGNLSTIQFMNQQSPFAVHKSQTKINQI